MCLIRIYIIIIIIIIIIITIIIIIIIVILTCFTVGVCVAKWVPSLSFSVIFSV